MKTKKSKKSSTKSSKKAPAIFEDENRKKTRKQLLAEREKAPERPVKIKKLVKAQYGRVGLVDYVESGTGRNLSEMDMLKLNQVPPSYKLSTLIEIQEKNLQIWTNSIWRLIGDPVLYAKFGPVSEFDNGKRRVHGFYVDEWLPEYATKPSLWDKYYEKILDANSASWARFGQMCRHSGIITLPMIRKGTELSPTMLRIIARLWKLMGFPVGKSSKGYSTVFRFYVLSSSVPGKTGDDKLRYLSKYSKSIAKKLVLVADDISIKDCIRIAKELEIRASYDLVSVRASDGSFYTPNTKAYQYVKKITWTDNKGSSGYPPVILCREMNENKEQKVLKAFTKSQSPVLLY